MADLKQLAATATLIAMSVRDSLEDFHVEHLSDEQMGQLNPLIRNSIYSALVLMTCAADESHPQRNRNARAAVCFLSMVTPPYWEPPRLTDEILRILEGNAGAGIAEQQRIRLAELYRRCLNL